MDTDLITKLKHALANQKWLVFPLVLFALSITLQARGTYDPADNWLTDLRMERTQVPASDEIAVIAIDPDSLKHIGTWPWSRAVHADILDRLVTLGAGTILYDVDFAFASDPAGDAAFAEALDRAGGATLLATFFQRGTDGNIVYNQPHQPFYDRSWPAVVSVSPDASGQIRDYPTGATIDGMVIPSAGVQLAGSYANTASSFAINYGISPQSIPVFSASDLLTGKLTVNDIAGRSFLIGATATELGDHFSVPLHQVIPGVMVHALAAETLLQGATISFVPSVWLLPPLFVLLCALQFVGRRRAWRLVSLAILSGIGVELGAALAFGSGFNTVSTAMFHPALIMLAIGRLAMNVDFFQVLVQRQKVQMGNDERLRQHIFENSSDGFLALNTGGETVFQSDVAKRMLGTGDLPQGLLSIARHVTSAPDPHPMLDQLEIDTATGPRFFEVHANASEMQSLDHGHNVAREPLALITLRDVTDLKQKQRKIAFLSRHDDRTLALRRHSFGAVIEDRIKRGDNFAVAAIALRRLTALNATLGRDIGDQVLTEAVRRLMDPAMALGEVARLEGSVFGVVIPNVTSDNQLKAECARIQTCLTQHYHLGGSQIQIGASIGYLAMDPTQTLTGEGYLSHAQDALAHARTTPTDTISAYDSADSGRRERSRRLEHALSKALENGEFHLLYQPQYRLSDRSLIGAEALIRWNSPEFGLVSPAEFVPIAESSGFVTDLGRFVLESAIQRATMLPDHLAMSPNVSAFQLLSADFPNLVSDLLQRHGLSPDRLCLELTESEYLSPDSEAVARMHAVRSLGVTWALDDFGTGYSSLSYLKELPFDKIKLDRAFLKDVLVDPEVQSALKSLVQMVQGFGKTLLCEGAETREEVDLLTRIGCDSVQGYYFGRPEPFEDLRNRALSEIRAEQSLLKAQVGNR